MHRPLRGALMAALLVPSLAAAAEFTDKGTALPRDPYEGNTALTTGRIEGFRTLYGDPDALAASLAPTTPSGPRAALPVNNDRSSWAEVTVFGQKIGVMGPYGRGFILDVPGGTYSITLSYPTGFVVTTSVMTEAPPANPPPDLPPLPQDVAPDPKPAPATP